jgi:hypothetical protein
VYLTKVKNDDEVDEIKQDMRKVDEGGETDRADFIDKRHKTGEMKDGDKKAEAIFERKMDYRCEGRVR